VRLQPELLVNAFYSITLSVTPVLINPVKGANSKSIGSFYGDPRDGGKRKHEGIDIFAPKGTEVLAPTAGVVTRVANGGIGGKTIWMNDTKRGHSYYFAHLDEQYVKQGDRVKQGDVLGTVGNTGNAQRTSSHLHFGVYQRNAVDPLAYIRVLEKLVNELAPDTLFQSVVFKVKPKTATLYAGPTDKSLVRTQLPKDGYLKIIAQTGDWYRARTADDREGFVKKDKLRAADKGNKIVLKKPVWLLAAATRDAVPVTLLKDATIEGLASYKNYQYVKTADGLVGWVDIAEL
jgi:SH3-like domain-containing protein